MTTYLDAGDPCPFCGQLITWVDHLPGVNGRPVQCKRPLNRYAGFGAPAAIGMPHTPAARLVLVSNDPTELECSEARMHTLRMLDGGDAIFGRTDDGYDDPRGAA